MASEQEKTRIRAKSYRYHYEGDQLIHKGTAKPIPAMADRASIVAKAHSYGHFGIDKTTNIVQNHYWWWGLKDQVKEHVKSCAPCKLGLAKFNEPITMQPIAVQGIYHKVGIDMIGPLQISSSGNRYIVTTIDYMSKNIEATALPSKSSKIIADFFHRDIICRHGTPVEVVSDQGGEFKGDFQELLDKCGIDHRLTSAYHPQANGMTERANQTIQRALIKMVENDPHNWDKQIPTVLMGYRASKQASTKYSPFFMLHGHDMVLPLNNKGRTVIAEHGELSEDCVADVFGPTIAILDSALANIHTAQERQKANYASRHLHGATAPTEDSAAEAPKTAPKQAQNAMTQTTFDQEDNTINMDPSSSKAHANTATEPAPTVVPKTTHVKQERGQVKHKKRQPVVFEEGDFVAVKIHKINRKEGDEKGKLAPKAEGPFLITAFTDDTKQMAILEDATGVTWTKRTADLSLWT